MKARIFDKQPPFRVKGLKKRFDIIRVPANNWHTGYCILIRRPRNGMDRQSHARHQERS